MIVEYDDDIVNQETLKLDGIGTQSNTGFMGALRTSSAVWSAWGDTLNVKSITKFGSMNIESAENWTVENNGKVLSITQISESPRGRQQSTIVYNRE